MACSETPVLRLDFSEVIVIRNRELGRPTRGDKPGAHATALQNTLRVSHNEVKPPACHGKPRLRSTEGTSRSRV